MNDVESLSHTKWECKYHIVFIPKYRRKVLYGPCANNWGSVLKQLARQRESRIEEGHLRPTTCTCWCRFRPSTRWRKWWGI